jgi:glycosyltransferase involved in cell wall biosynthesis
MRVLFFNEGNLGTHIMGQGQLQEAILTGLPLTPDVQERFAGLHPMGRMARAAATRPVQPLARAGLDFHTLRWHLVQSLRARRALSRELRAWPADVIHIHSQSVALAIPATMRALPVALSVDTTVRDWWSMPAWRPADDHAAIAIEPSCALERRAFQRARLTLAWTAWSRRAVERSAPGARVVEHHPGIDLDRYRPAPRRGRERPRVLFVGGRFAEKGGEDLLDALAGGLGEHVELDLVTPAQVPARPGVRVHRLEPSDPRLLELQQQADLFCLPTYGDAVPWAILEAMACGTPVLSTRVGGIPDLLDDGRAGALVKHGDRRGLREALERLLLEPQSRARLATQARARCEERYDARRQIPRLVEHLRELAESHPQAGAARRSRTRTSSTPNARSPKSSAG